MESAEKGGGGAPATARRPSYGNGMDVSLLLANVADLLAIEMRKANNQPTDPTQLSSLCLCLSRVIDYAVACNEVPSRVQELPLLLRQVCKHSNATSIQAAVMVLMISVRNACKMGWFPCPDTAHLLILAKQVANIFSNDDDVDVSPNIDLPIISKIINRFYPKTKLGCMLVFLQVKPGYKAVVADFNISNETATPLQEEIGLFVAKIDDINTSSCIVTPPRANFLLNGKGVQGRINVSMDTEPQLPTNVTAVLGQGMNFLQAVGHFDGDYIVVLAYMHEISSFDIPVLQDYVQPVTPSDSCSDVIPEPSKVSLNCAISNRRMRTPVKGHSCNHYQCFDYKNFMMLNAKRPIWRCPVCNQSVCYTDIRIDQNIAQILREVGDNAIDVIISANGSWKVIFESDDSMDQAHQKMQGCQRERPKQHDSGGLSSVPADVIDRTLEEADTSLDIGILGSEGRKDQENLLNFPFAENLVPSDADNTLLGSTSAAAAASTVDCSTAGISDFPCSTSTGPSDQNNLTTPVLNKESGDVNRANQVLLTPPPDCGLDSNNLQSHRHRVDSSISNSGYGGKAGGVFSTNQAFPSQAQYPSLSEITRNLNSWVPNGASSQRMPFVSFDARIAGNVSTESSQQFGRVSMNSLPVPDMPSNSTQNHLLAQNLASHHVTDQVGQQVPSPTPGASSSLYRPPSWCPPRMGSTQATIPSENILRAPQHGNLSRMRTTQAAIPSQNMFLAPQNSNLFGMRTTQAASLYQNMFHRPQNSNISEMRTAQVAIPSQNLIRPQQYLNVSGMTTTQVATPSQDLVQARQYSNLPATRSSIAAPPPQNMVQAPLNSNYTTQATTPFQNRLHPSSDAQALQFQQRAGSANEVAGAVINDQLPRRTAAQSVSHISRTASFEQSGKRSSLTGGTVTQPHKTTVEQRDAVGTGQLVSGVETSDTLASLENWRPTGRMRGSLTGKAYDDALKQFMTRPTQFSQAATNPSN